MRRLLSVLSQLAIFAAVVSAVEKTGPSHGKAVFCVGNEKSIGANPNNDDIGSYQGQAYIGYGPYPCNNSIDSFQKLHCSSN